MKCASQFPKDGGRYAAAALGSLREALRCFAAGAGVLARYHFTPADDQLYKDIEGVLEACQEGLCWAATAETLCNAGAGGAENGHAAVTPRDTVSDPECFRSLLVLWDGVCMLFTGKPKPGGWVALLLKLAKRFDPEAREAAASTPPTCTTGVAGAVAAAQQSGWESEPMRKAAGLWGPLKPSTLRPLFESADVAEGEGRAIKRPRR